MANPLTPEVRDLLTLHLLPGLGPRLTALLLEHFGSASAVLRADAARLREIPHIGPKLSENLYRAMQALDVDGEIALMARHGVSLLVKGTPGYPAALADIPDAPHLLYVRGILEARDANAVAVVGSRRHTHYGRKITERLAAGLARAGYTVISGLARGIDAIAHRAALQAGGRTVAVLAGGLSRIYPPEHADLADEVARQGALVSEAAMKMEPLAGMFPARNRLISGMSRAVVIVEANEKSGALITAQHAAEQGRHVFAVPGPVDCPTSAGTNALIREGAVLVRGAEDVLEELDGIRSPALFPESQRPPPGLDETQQRLWEFLAEQPRHLDEMAQQLGLPVPQLVGALLALEMKKLVRRLPGNRYERR